MKFKCLLGLHEWVKTDDINIKECKHKNCDFIKRKGHIFTEERHRV